MANSLNKYLFIVFSCLCLLGTAQDGFTNKSEAKNELVKGAKEGKWVEFYNEDWKITADSGLMYYYRLTVYKAGEPYGIVREYFKAGKLHAEVFYVNGKKNGIEREYDQSGNLIFEVHYKDGKFNGKHKFYLDNGVLYSECSYTNGKKNGVEKWYYGDGKLERETPYVNDEKNGIAYSYYENGKLESETLYNNGKKIASKQYDENEREIK